jgi:hypothetical protein
MPSQGSIRHHALGALAAASMAAALVSNFAHAGPLYDGVWQISILTKKGECGNGQRYPVRITDGALGTARDTGFAISGRVSESGRVAVTVRNGDKNATGHGRLAGRSGGGTWTGAACSGTWSAVRWHNGRVVASD